MRNKTQQEFLWDRPRPTSTYIITLSSKYRVKIHMKKFALSGCKRARAATEIEWKDHIRRLARLNVVYREALLSSNVRPSHAPADCGTWRAREPGRSEAKRAEGPIAEWARRRSARSRRAELAKCSRPTGSRRCTRTLAFPSLALFYVRFSICYVLARARVASHSRTRKVTARPRKSLGRIIYREWSPK